MKLKRLFFIRPSLVVAKDMLGKYIVHQIGNKKLVGKIVETEAYPGPYDKASHAFGYKKTQRNKAEYLIGGHIYIYLVYGMYWQFNISTGKAEYPECVLVRAIEVMNQESGIMEHKLKKEGNGPGKLCRYLQLDKRLYGIDVCISKEIWLEDRGEKIKKSDIVSAKRINIDYAGKKWADKKWRFYIKDNLYVSR